MSGFNSSDASSSAVLPANHRPTQPLAHQTDELLSLTVHSLPSPDQTGSRSGGGRWKMLAVLAVCAAPVVASYFTYYVLRPTQQRSFGELIAEQPVLPEMQAQTLDGRAVPLSQLKGQWLLVSTASGDCGERCESHLYLQRQLRETLGKEKDRLDWVWLIHDGQPVPDRIQPGLAQATVLRLPAASIAQWLQPAAGQALEDHLYLVDPQGHWMMRFPADLSQANAGKAKRDLERLLRAASSWDEAGRAEVKP